MIVTLEERVRRLQAIFKPEDSLELVIWATRIVPRCYLTAISLSGGPLGSAQQQLQGRNSNSGELSQLRLKFWSYMGYVTLQLVRNYIGYGLRTTLFKRHSSCY